MRGCLEVGVGVSCSCRKGIEGNGKDWQWEVGGMYLRAVFYW